MSVRSFIDRRPFTSAFIFVVVVLSGMIALTGCATDDVPAFSEEGIETEEVASTPPPIDPFWHPFEEIHTYEDGVEVLVKAPQEFELSDRAIEHGTPREHHVVFHIVVSNGSTESFSLDALPIVTFGDWEATRVEDNDTTVGPITLTPGIEIAPGEKVEWNVAYAVDTLDDITMRIRPTFDHEELRFTNILP